VWLIPHLPITYLRFHSLKDGSPQFCGGADIFRLGLSLRLLIIFEYGGAQTECTLDPHSLPMYGDAVLIADERVARVNICYQKSLISKTGCAEFAKGLPSERSGGGLVSHLHSESVELWRRVWTNGCPNEIPLQAV